VSAGVTVLVALTALVACSPPATVSAKDELVLGIAPDQFGFIKSPLEGGIVGYVGLRAEYESLLTIDAETSEFEPLLAKGFELADDRRSMTLTLRDDVDFVDGTHFDAEALVDYTELLLASEAYTYGAQVVGRYALEVTALSEYEVELTTQVGIDETFFNTFLLYTPIASPTAAADREGLSENAAGTGPYVRVDAVPDVSISFERNLDYWDRDAYAFDSLEYQVFTDDVAAGNALRSGQIDAFQASSGALVQDLVASGFSASVGGGSATLLAILDFGGAIVPALGDVRVRQAIAMAIDQEGILQSLELGYGTVSDQAFSPTGPGYLEGEDDRYPYDVDAARELMAEAGYADGFDVVIPSAPVSFYPTDYEPVLQEMLGAIGVRVTFESQADVGGLIGSWSNGAYPIMLSELGYWQTLSFFQGEAPLAGHYGQDPTFRNLSLVLDDGTIEESDEAAHDLAEHILDESWWVPIAHTGPVWVYSRDIELRSGKFLPYWLDLRDITVAS
jgi:peptide/nickel transport system substrate-binding protein